MIYLLLIPAAVLYITMGAWTFGYAGQALDDPNAHDTPMPVLAAIFWPIAITLIGLANIAKPACDAGAATHKRKIEKIKIRIEEERKLRIQMEEVEKELEEEMKISRAS